MLSEIGEALYGERWKAPLARDLGVSIPTLVKWMYCEMPNDKMKKLLRLIAKRANKLSDLHDQLFDIWADSQPEEESAKPKAERL